MYQSSLKENFAFLEQELSKNVFSLKFNKIIFLMPLIFLANPAYAETLDIEMDWLIEGETNNQNFSPESQNIISNYEEFLENEKDEKEKIVYDKFVTGNEYSMGDYKITIDSEEGQILNGIIVEQRELQHDSFIHKIQYYDRFSDGYVEIAEALLDPIGNNKYLINGRSFDYNPNSNLEFFVLERGYDLENLEAIPNHIFTPTSLDEARQMIADSQKHGGEFDLNEFSPNYMRLDGEEVQQRMMNTITEQTSNIFTEILTGKKLQSDGTFADIEVMISQPRGPQSIFDNFKLEQPQFENTMHVRDRLQDNTFPTLRAPQSMEDLSLLLIIPVFVGLAIFGYMMRRKLFERKLEEPIMQVVEPQIDFRQLTHQMLQNSLNLYKDNQRKEAHEVLSQAIRYYYSKKLGINKELTNFELLSNLRKSKISDYDNIRKWLVLCGSVEYAKYKSKDNDFTDALSKFSDII